MARGKQKSRDNNCFIHSKWQQPTEVELDSIITMHRYNTTMFVERMDATLNNCIQMPFAIKYIQITHSNGIWQGFDYTEALQSLPEMNNPPNDIAT